MNRGTPWWTKQLSPDGLHPNVIGYRALLDDVLDWEPFGQL
ncbi:hypothetical protein MC7420_7537 [Coleofasciculus chthonoplastes PCC 7420]|uniref:SGNH hydrolase-type esterase domain-containing protein n=1 Tax=Coleofasciculus chthonoplastes PCC 7420 TaxID=118168 RepID=B4W158_9CYAN|nr:hypothetical protein [Coleofasciculus chthonoplastes]EDX72057.1 hypothetical protein MC7420_7537 [Coleofasciculus chthonoplastes PCC 7420]